MDRYEDAKLRIKEATDLVALIESYMPLRPRGRTLVALCPFHAEGSPSFTVYRDTQHYHCYGCGKHGDVFTWLMERDGLTFREAMELLGERCGVSLEGVFQKGGRGEQNRKRARDAYEALAAVADFFHRSLLTPAGEPARDYLSQRGLDDAIEPWKLGFHPLAGELTKFAREQRLPKDVLEQAGLLRNGRESFAGRLIFPIVDERGRTVAFGGRILPGVPGNEPRGDYKPPKYLNSPESPWFSKRRVLYGLHAAKQAGERRLVVMEGYTDVIACHLAGFRGAVASLGTAFTAEHARIVERYADDGVVLMFDGDRAGKQAAGRAMRELVNSRLLVRIAIVSDGDEGAKDPADVVLAQPGEDEEVVTERRARFADMIDGAEQDLAVWFRLLRQRLDFTQAANVEAAARECAGLLDLVEVPVRQAALTEQMARHLAVPTTSLERMLRATSRRKARPAGRGQQNDGADGPPLDVYEAMAGEQAQFDAAGDGPDGGAIDPGVPGGGAGGGAAATPPSRPRGPISMIERAERELLACLLAKPVLLVDLDLDEMPLQVPAIAQLFEWAAAGLAVGREQGPQLFSYLYTRAAEQPALQRLLTDAQGKADKLKEPAEVFAGIVARRREDQSKDVRRDLRQQITKAIAAGDMERAKQLQQQMLDLHRRERPRPNDDGRSGSSGDQAGGSAGDPTRGSAEGDNSSRDAEAS